MSKKRNGKTDWKTIEADYRNGDKSLRQLSEEYGVPFSTIRSRAEREGWVRASPELKRDLVRKTLSIGNLAQESDQIHATEASGEVIRRARELMAKEVAKDVLILEKALSAASKLVDIIEEHTEDRFVEGDDGVPQKILPEPKDVQSLSNALKINIENVMRIRGLNPSDETEDLDEKSRGILKRFRQNVEA